MLGVHFRLLSLPVSLRVSPVRSLPVSHLGSPVVSPPAPQASLVHNLLATLVRSLQVSLPDSLPANPALSLRVSIMVESILTLVCNIVV